MKKPTKNTAYFGGGSNGNNKGNNGIEQHFFN
jgi:hypothetical protein